MNLAITFTQKPSNGHQFDYLHDKKPPFLAVIHLFVYLIFL